MGDFNEKALFGSKSFSKSKKKHQQKNKHVDVPVHPTRATLASNHCFYADELSSEEDTSDHSSAPDFNQLINSSVQNVGGHFYFKDEKKAMAENKEETLKSSLFYIDGKLLQRALATIPFHERLGYELEHFTVDEIEAQERDAAKHEDAYRSLCENRGRDLIINKIQQRAKSAKKLPEIKKDDPYESRDELEDILEGTKAFKIVVEPIRTTRKTPENRRKTPEPESKENMQNWLDNLLN